MVSIHIFRSKLCDEGYVFCVVKVGTGSMFGVGFGQHVMQWCLVTERVWVKVACLVYFMYTI